MSQAPTQGTYRHVQPNLVPWVLSYADGPLTFVAEDKTAIIAHLRLLGLDPTDWVFDLSQPDVYRARRKRR